MMKVFGGSKYVENIANLLYSVYRSMIHGSQNIGSGEWGSKVGI